MPCCVHRLVICTSFFQKLLSGRPDLTTLCAVSLSTAYRLGILHLTAKCADRIDRRRLLLDRSLVNLVVSPRLPLGPRHTRCNYTFILERRIVPARGQLGWMRNDQTALKLGRPFPKTRREKRPH